MLEEAEILAEENEAAKKLAEKEDTAWVYKTRDLRQFDPYKKFGCIEDGNQIIYDDISTCY